MSTANPGGRRRAQLEQARLYLVCDSRPSGRELSDVLHAAIDGGVNVVQLRDKQLPDDQLASVAHAAHALCQQLGALFIVNDRPHVALQAGADGVHLGQDDMPIEQVRQLVGPDLLIGLSTHAPREVDAATRFAGADEGGAPREVDAVTRLASGGEQGGARRGGPGQVPGAAPYVDYIGVGPVHATPTKPGRPPVGYELVNYASAHAHVPFFAIGGIDSHNVSQVIHAGAARVCVLRAVANAPDPRSAAAELRAALDGALQPTPDGNGGA